MPFNCDVCGEECSYDSRVFKLRNNAEIVICNECLGGPVPIPGEKNG